MPTIIYFTGKDSVVVDDTLADVAARFNNATSSGKLMVLKRETGDEVYVNPAAVTQIHEASGRAIASF